MQLFHFLRTALVASLAVTSIAAPLPTDSECKAKLNVPAGKTLFWSGRGDPQGRDYAVLSTEVIAARPYLSGYQVVGQMFTDTTWRDTYANDRTVSGQFWDNVSQALAELTTGTAYVLLPNVESGLKWAPGSVWDRVEYLVVRDSAAVATLIRINPDSDT